MGTLIIYTTEVLFGVLSVQLTLSRDSFCHGEPKIEPVDEALKTLLFGPFFVWIGEKCP